MRPERNEPALKELQDALHLIAEVLDTPDADVSALDAIAARVFIPMPESRAELAYAIAKKALASELFREPDDIVLSVV
jgi:hypothetical protein